MPTHSWEPAPRTTPKRPYAFLRTCDSQESARTHRTRTDSSHKEYLQDYERRVDQASNDDGIHPPVVRVDDEQSPAGDDRDVGRLESFMVVLA